MLDGADAEFWMEQVFYSVSSAVCTIIKHLSVKMNMFVISAMENRKLLNATKKLLKNA